MLSRGDLVRVFRDDKGKLALMAGALTAVMMISGVSAYFTDTDTASNTWTVGNVDLELVEAEYDGATSERENITPNKVLRKDPLVKNTGSNDAYVFMKFSIPKANVKIASDEGAVTEGSLQELFSYSIDSSWTQIKKEESNAANTYVYAYGTKSECTKLNPNETTSVIFKDSRIKFKNVVEGQGLEKTTLELPVEAYAIQTNDITSAGKSDPASVWAVLSGQANK